MKTFKILAPLFTLFLITQASAETVLINGAGATFPYPIYSKWFSEFHKIDASTEINYQSIGSGGGIRQLLDKTIDFGASDAPMTDEQLSKANPSIVHIPTVLGAVVVTYNLTALKTPLKITGEQIADIFLGKITVWNDPSLVKLNPGLGAIPDPIIVSHRSDGSGTTAVFSDYLSKVSSEWKQKVGAGNALQWPVGLGGKGNEGVTGIIKQAVGTIGYTELSYAANNHLPVALVKNLSGNFVAPSAKSVTAAAHSFAKSMPKDFRISITNPAASAKDAYPVSSFTYLLVYQTMDKAKGTRLLGFLQWALTDGQKLAEGLTYAPLPAELVVQVKNKLKELKTQ
jgi:phosphate transport system substrate-binding protein